MLTLGEWLRTSIQRVHTASVFDLILCDFTGDVAFSHTVRSVVTVSRCLYSRTSGFSLEHVFTQICLMLRMVYIYFQLHIHVLRFAWIFLYISAHVYLNAYLKLYFHMSTFISIRFVDVCFANIICTFR